MSKLLKWLLSFCLCALTLNLLVESQPTGNEIKDGNESFKQSAIPRRVTSFGYGILKQLNAARPRENILISPVSAYAALMVLHLAAGGETTKKLEDVLKIHDTQGVDYTTLHETFGEILRAVEHHDGTSNSSLETMITNGFFVQKNHPIHDSFMRELRRYYEANVTNLDFAEHASEATDAINSWIAKNTKNRIENSYHDTLSSKTMTVLTSALYFRAPWQDLSSKTMAVLTSALYFRGAWQDRFEDDAEEEEFSTGMSEIKVPMMQNKKIIWYSYSNALQADAIKLQYKGGDYYMKIVLPYTSQTLQNMTAHINSDLVLQELIQNKQEVGVDYKIPKMKLSWKDSLVDALGLEDVFRNADLSRMTPSKIPISEMVQATEMEVDEEGTVATAATGVFGHRKFLVPVRTFKEFYVNRPFYVAIVHKPTRMPLFQANVYKPYH